MCVGPYCLDDIFTDYLNYLSWYEYIIFVIVLIISLAIGVFYGFFGSKNKTNGNFLYTKFVYDATVTFFW